MNLYVNGGLCPNDALLDALEGLEDGQIHGEELLAYKSSAPWDGEEWEEDETEFPHGTISAGIHTICFV